MTKVVVGFGYRVPQDMSGYPSGRGGTFYFSFEVDGKITSKKSAFIAAGFFREKFLEETKMAGISSRMQMLTNEDGSRVPWIPTCYLDACDYTEVDGKELVN